MHNIHSKKHQETPRDTSSYSELRNRLLYSSRLLQTHFSERQVLIVHEVLWLAQSHWLASLLIWFKLYSDEGKIVIRIQRKKALTQPSAYEGWHSQISPQESSGWGISLTFTGRPLIYHNLWDCAETYAVSKIRNLPLLPPHCDGNVVWIRSV